MAELMPDSCHSGRSGTELHLMAITWKNSCVSLVGLQVADSWLLALNVT